MNPSSFNWLLSVKSTANQMNVASTSPWLAMSSSVMTPVTSSAPRPRNAIAVESSPKRRGRRPERDHDDEDDQDDPFLARERAERRERLPRGGRRVWRRPHFGSDEPVEDDRQQRHRAERRHGRGEQPSAEPDLDAEPAGDLGAERVGRHRRQPQRRRHAEAGDARIHQERAEPPPVRAIGLRAGRIGQRQRQRIEHAGARGVAGKRRRDHGVEQEDRIGQPERRSAEPADDPVPAARAEAALDHGAGDEKRDDDEQDRAVGEAGVGLLGLEQAGEDGGRNREHRRRQDRQRADDDREDRRRRRCANSRQACSVSPSGGALHHSAATSAIVAILATRVRRRSAVVTDAPGRSWPPDRAPRRSAVRSGSSSRGPAP